MKENIKRTSSSSTADIKPESNQKAVPPLDEASCSASSFSVACKDIAKHLGGLREAYSTGGDVLKSHLDEYHRLNQICKDEYVATHGVR